MKYKLWQKEFWLTKKLNFVLINNLLIKVKMVGVVGIYAFENYLY